MSCGLHRIVALTVAAVLVGCTAMDPDALEIESQHGDYVADTLRRVE